MASAHLKTLEANSCFCFGFVLFFWDWLLKQQLLIHLRILPCIHFAQNSQTRKKNRCRNIHFHGFYKMRLEGRMVCPSVQTGEWQSWTLNLPVFLFQYNAPTLYKYLCLSAFSKADTLSTFRSLPIRLTLVFPESVSVHVLHTSSHAHCDGTA